MSNDPNPKAIANAETLLRMCRTGEVSGFVAVCTDEVDVCSFQQGGRVNMTQTVCLLEHLRLTLLGQFIDRFNARDDNAVLEVVDP